MAGIVDELNAITNPMFVGHTTDLIEDAYPCWDYFYEKADVRDDVRDDIKATLRYKMLPTQTFSGFDTLTTNAVQQLDSITVGWAQVSTPIAISEEQLIKTVNMNLEEFERSSGSRMGGEKMGMLVNLMADKMASAYPSHADAFSGFLFGTGFDGAQQTIDGFDNIIKQNTASYAGKAITAFGTDTKRSATNFWASFVTDAAGLALDTNMLGDILTPIAMRGRYKYKKGQKNQENGKAWCSPDAYTYLEQMLGQSAIHNTGTAASLDYDSFSYKGFDFIPTYEFAETHDAFHIWFTNPRTIKLYVAKAQNMRMSAWRIPTNQRAMVCYLLTMAQVVCTDRHANACLHNFVLD